MSAQAGILYFDRRPIGADLSKRLDASIVAYGPDGGGEYVGPGLVMVHRALHITPEDQLERQPYVSKRGNVMTWDGRLDNREDLVLQLCRELGNQTTDVALATAACETWSEDGLARLIGDWSLALWRPERQEVVLASDYMGIRPLYYCQTDEYLIWSTDLALVVEHTGRFDEVEPRFIAGYLTFSLIPNLTPYRGILSVPPANALTISSSGKATKRSFWSFGGNRFIYKNPVDYAVHLRTAFRDAVRARLRATKPVWAELSGGLDSSSIVCMASHLVRTGSATSRSLHTVSHITDHSPESDERRFICEVERWCGCPATHLNMDEYALFSDAYGIVPRGVHPIYFEVERLMQQQGARVLLSGRLGDGVMANFPDDPSALLDGLSWRTLPQALTFAHQESLVSQIPLLIVLGRALQSFLPHSIQRGLEARRQLARHAPPERLQAPTPETVYGLRSTFLREIGFEFSASAGVMAHEGSNHNHQVFQGLCNYALRRSLETPNVTPYTIRTYPYADRILVEFVLAIPAEVLRTPGRPRLLMRNAFVGFVPDIVLRRFSKGYASPFLVRALIPLATDLLSRVDRLRVVLAGYVDPSNLKSRLSGVVNGSLTKLGNLPNIAAMELWFEARAGRFEPSANVKMEGR